MKILTWNVNGIRAILKKGFLGWLEKSEADIVCLQEIKLQADQVPKELISPSGYFSYWSFAEKRGYAGVVVFCKQKPLTEENEIGFPKFDQEGRVLRLQYPEFDFYNLYLPHGGRQKENLGYKLETYEFILRYLKKIKDHSVILAGDFNIAHEDIDLARPKDNKNNTMFTAEERKQIDKIIELGFADSFRQFHQEGGHYTWWPYFANARERNFGWRIDYIFVSSVLLPKVKSAFILPEVTGSDHCPTGIEVKF